MKSHALKNAFLTTFFIAIATICVIFTFTAPPDTIAEGVDIGTVTVSYDGENYVYSDGSENTFSDASLQNVINYAESSYSQLIFNFNCTAVDEPLVFKKNSVLQGELDFELNTNGYAITAASGATLTLQGLTVNSNRGAIQVNFNGNLNILSATITVADCNTTCSAIDVRGSASISGATIVYSDQNTAFGYGISVNGGNLTVAPEVESDVEIPVIINGHSGLCMTSGYTEIKGGDFISNRTGSSSAGYSVDFQGGNLTINGGDFSSPIYDRANASAKIDINGGNVSSVRMTQRQSKKININSVTIFTGNYCELNIYDFTSNSVTIEGEKSSEGFRVAGFTVSGITVDGKILTVDTDKEETIVPIEDNHYYVNLSCDGTIYKTVGYEYGSTVRLSELLSPEKIGYTLSGWEEKKGDFTISDDITLNAVTVLCDAEIEIANTVLTYNGSEQTISPILKHDLSVTYTTFWERYVTNVWEKVSDGNVLNLTAVADSGIYRFTAVATYGTDSSTAQKEVTITINKGHYENIELPEFSGVYDPSKRLNSYALPSYFSWVKVGTHPEVPIKLYPAIYNADPDNYEDYEVYIKIDLEKAAGVTAPPHANLSGVYEKKTLKDYPLDENFRWQSPDQIPVVNNRSYVALYNPDTYNYEDTTLHIILVLEKGNYNGIKHLDDMTLTYRPNYFLSDLSSDIAMAHANYRLKFSSNSKVNAGTTKLECIYNDDSDNYNDYVFTFNLTVNKADISPEDVPQIPSFTGVYSGLTLSSYLLGGNVYWRNPELIATVDVLEYEAYYNPDSKNYNDYPITITISLQKGVYENIAFPTLNAITYNRNMTLSDISLPEFWSWTDATINPTVAVNGYRAQYCDDNVNYQPFITVISLTVNKADITPAVLPDKTVTYDGKEHSLELKDLPYPLVLVGYENNGQVKAGQYEITAKLLQTDTDNYNLHPTTARGILHILKAPSVINSPSRYDVLEGNTVIIEGTVDNEEQTLIIPEFNETTFGLYSVTLTTAESSNYLAGSHTVTISINKTEKYVGNISYPAGYDGSYLYGILVNTDCGVPNDAAINFRPFKCENYFMGIEISVTVDGSAYDKKFTAKIKMTNEMLSASALRLFAEDGTEIAFTVENNAYLVFETNGNEVFYLNAEFDKEFAWYWIPIGIALALIAIGAILVVLWKKGIIKPRKMALDKNTDKIAEDTGVQTANAQEPQVQKANPEAEIAVTESIKEQESEENLERE